MTAATHPAPPSLTPLLKGGTKLAGQELGIYGVEFIPLAGRVAALARQTQTFKVGEDHAFLIVMAACSVMTAANGAVAVGPLQFQVTMDRASDGNKQLIQQTVPGANDAPGDAFFGTGQFPCFWPDPVILRPNETFVVILTNYVATALNIRLSFIGARLFRDPAKDPWAAFRGGFA